VQEISNEDIEYLSSFVDYIEKWATRHKETAQKLEIGRKITGFIGEALTSRELKKHFRIECVWKGGAQGGYDIHFKRSKEPIKISIKTTVDALRYKGRGDKKKPYGYQWSLGWGDEKHAKDPYLWFVFVDLKNLEGRPDFYIVPSRIIRKHFTYGTKATWPWPRWHPRFKIMQKYRGKWPLLRSC
jgi:hypothetical protein